MLLFSVRSNELRLEDEVPTLSWKFYMNILQPKLRVISCCNLRLMYYPATPILNPPHTPKKGKSKVELHIIIHEKGGFFTWRWLTADICFGLILGLISTP